MVDCQGMGDSIGGAYNQTHEANLKWMYEGGMSEFCFCLGPR